MQRALLRLTIYVEIVSNTKPTAGRKVFAGCKIFKSNQKRVRGKKFMIVV